jgi:hypothetical protein
MAAPARAEVRVFVQEVDGRALVNYACTSGEVVRSFALDVSVDRGQIAGIANFFRGESSAQAQGYGIFPASFRDHITVGSGTGIVWDVSDYTPLANPADKPGETLPGLNSNGVTLEFGGLWNPGVPASVPGPTGTLCSLQLTEAAQVSVAANAARGGIVSASPDVVIAPAFSGAPVDPDYIRVTEVSNDNLSITIRFKGGELATSPSIEGEWTGTGNTSGEFVDPLGDETSKYYRVLEP